MRVHNLADADSRAAFQERVIRDVDVADALFRSGAAFSSRDRCAGVEQELQFIGRDSRPAHVAEKLALSLPAPTFQEEFSRFTFEIALPPIKAEPDLLTKMDAELREHLGQVERVASASDARVVLCGILPSLRIQDIGEDALTASPRYEMLRQLRQDAKGSASEYQIRGIDDLVLPNSQPLLLDGVFTSLQLHWQVCPQAAAGEYNWSQLITAPCLAAACCSPIFLGHRLWHETRVTLFQQASDLDNMGAVHQATVARAPRSDTGGSRTSSMSGRKNSPSTYPLWASMLRSSLKRTCVPGDPPDSAVSSSSRAPSTAGTASATGSGLTRSPASE